MDPFGGGLDGHGETCGIVIGGLAAIGLRFGRSKPGQEADIRMRKCSRLFVRRFRDEVADGKILCRDITGVDWRDPVQVKSFREGGGRDACQALIGKTAKILGEMLERSCPET